MKKYFFIVLALAAAFILTSFGFSLPSQFEHFVDKVEKNAPEYTKEDWNKASEQFKKLMEKYKEAFDNTSEEDKVRIDKAIGKYRAIVFKYGVSKSFDESMKTLGPKLESLGRRIESFFEELSKEPAE